MHGLERRGRVADLDHLDVWIYDVAPKSTDLPHRRKVCRERGPSDYVKCLHGISMRWVESHGRCSDLQRDVVKRDMNRVFCYDLFFLALFGLGMQVAIETEDW